MSMRRITTTSGAEIVLDGDLLAVLEGVYRELVSLHGLDHTFQDTMRELRHVIQQMNDDERQTYLIESLFLNTVTYENEKAAAYLNRLAKNGS